MNWWQQLTDLGGLNVTAPIALALAVWLGAAHCVRLALYWCAVFGAAMLAVVASKLAFLGWGIGSQALDFAGFSGHAARAAAVFPVALGLLLNACAPRVRNLGLLAGLALGFAVAVSRVMVGAHSASEALLGYVLGLGVALLFVRRARAAVDFRPSPLLVAVSLAMVLLLPKLDPRKSQQWMIAAALHLSGHDRIYQRPGWRMAPAPYVPPCAPKTVRLAWVCT